ncbi:MAG: mechanosensitive ion channel family protein [Jaaginema sp. PMC 1079.18]|nr:mechanosensitive ion channel family protein [Jaaginema sp. PMC 1080.18]MEC4852699.1 mechanosensitive ion channel family protein [Jaaginema sp. PMC 1079.18]MEC4865971.1 mechanosensitive ion channel family protein [Jaaginema sp. PMC 1078.18]
MNLETIALWIDTCVNFLVRYNILNLLIFALFVIIALVIGRYTPGISASILSRFFPGRGVNAYQQIIEPIQTELKVAGTLILLAIFAWIWLQTYFFYEFIKPFLDLALVLSVAWLASRLFRQLIRIYGIDIIRRFGWEVDELLLIFETAMNVIIGLFAVSAYAQSQNFPLTGLLAGVSIGGLAISFAAQNTLQQLFGTLVLYLDRPFIPGEYIRLPSGELGRVESVGLRSTKIRTAAKSTLMIIPNSTMANYDIENITRGKKVMVLLYLDFTRNLQPQEEALVEQITKESTDVLFGIDPGSTKITLIKSEETRNTRARVTFFILGSSENSIQLRKRLLELANETISKRLAEYGINFESKDPTIYVESPVTI